MTDRRPEARPPRVRAAEFAASRWTIASGSRLHVHLDDDHARVEIAILRDAKRMLAVMKDGVFAKAPPLSQNQAARRVA